MNPLSRARERAHTLARVRKTYGSTAALCVFSRAAWLRGSVAFKRGESGREGEEEGNDSTEGGGEEEEDSFLSVTHATTPNQGGKPREGREKNNRREGERVKGRKHRSPSDRQHHSLCVFFVCYVRACVSFWFFG